MMKDAEHQHHQQMYPSQIPSAPPSYDEAVFNSQVNAPFAQQYPQPSPAGFIPSQPVGSPYIQPSVVEVQRTIVALPLGPNPARITCPNCRAEVVTTTDTEPSCAAHLCCLLLLLIGCCPFSSLPYCMDSLKNVRHTCPNCKVFLGSYQP